MAEPRRIKTKAGWRYQADVRLSGFPRVTKRFEKRRDAVAWRDKKTQEFREGAGEASSGSNIKLEFIINKFLDEMVVTEFKSEQYRKDLKAHLKWWKKKRGQWVVNRITTRMLSDVRTEMLASPKKRQPATINRYFSSLSAVFTKAVNEWQMMEYNPLLSIKSLREPPGRTRWLSPEELERLVAAAKEIKNKPIYELIVLAIATGARRTELLTITRKNVLLNHQKIIIENTKNRTDRTLYLDGIPLELITAMMDRSRSKTYLFCSRRGDVPITIDREWKALVKKAKVKDFRFHDLRHTAAAYLAMNGATLNEIAELLGHKSFNMTKRYAHIADSHLKGVSGRVQKHIFNHSKKDQNHE